jgi:ribosomal protein S18 acetylase RimI-like enzyme
VKSCSYEKRRKSPSSFDIHHSLFDIRYSGSDIGEWNSKVDPKSYDLVLWHTHYTLVTANRRPRFAPHYIAAATPGVIFRTGFRYPARMSDHRPLPLPTVQPSSPPHRDALALLFHHLDDSQREESVEAILELVKSGEANLDALLLATRGVASVGAVWANPVGGTVATVWPPNLVAAEPEETADVLLANLHSRLQDTPLAMAQAVLESDTDLAADRLRRNGYEHAALLHYLVCPVNNPMESGDCPVFFEPFREEQRSRMIEIVNATYQNTRDCPRLNGLLEPADVLESYRSSGVYRPELWSFVRRKKSATDVGCLLLNDHPDHEQLELVYMGIVPTARGEGFGRHVTQHAITTAKRLGRRRVVLAVDALNRPAIDAYSAAGFSVCDQRHVFIRVFSASG